MRDLPAAGIPDRRPALPAVVPAEEQNGALGGERSGMDQTVSFQEILRRLTMIDEGLAESGAGLPLAPAAATDT